MKKIDKIEFDYIVDSIIDIFNKAPQVNREYWCHGESHFYSVPDTEIRNKNLKEFLGKYFTVNDTTTNISKVTSRDESIREAIKELKEQEPPHIPKHGILKRGF